MIFACFVVELCTVYSSYVEKCNHEGRRPQCLIAMHLNLLSCVLLWIILINLHWLHRFLPQKSSSQSCMGPSLKNYLFAVTLPTHLRSPLPKSFLSPSISILTQKILQAFLKILCHFTANKYFFKGCLVGRHVL